MAPQTNTDPMQNPLNVTPGSASGGDINTEGATPDPAIMPAHAQLLRMKQSAIDCLRWVDAIPNDVGFFLEDVERFLVHANICDITDIINIAETPYSNLHDLVDDILGEQGFFDRIAAFIIDLKLLVRFLNTVVQFPQLVERSNGNAHNAWLLVLDNDEQHQRCFQRFRRTYTKAEYETIRIEFAKDDASTVASHHTRRSVVSVKQPKRELRTAFCETPIREEGTDAPPAIPKSVTIESHVAENSKAMLAEASYQAALTALNESFLTKPPMKLIVRKEMHNKIRWDGQEKTFMAFKKQYEAYLMTSLQDYATDPLFRAAYIKQDSSYFKMCLKYEVSHVQVKSDTKQQYGALAMACSNNDTSQRFLSKFPRDGIRVWDEMVKWFQYGGTLENVLSQLETALQTEYSD
jgi:hypothetical protein